MLGDILLINDMHKEAACAIKDYVINDLQKIENGHRYVVSISGESGSGKSELAHSLGKILQQNNIRAKVIHTDNYYKVPPLLREEWRRNKGIDKVGIKEYDWIRINRTIRDFREAQECMLPCVDLIPEQVDRLITDFSKIDFLVIDGLYAIKTNDVDLRVFIDLTYHETKINQIIRMKEAMSEFRLEILEQEHKNVVSLKPLADLIVDKSYQVIDTNDDHIDKCELTSEN